MAPPLHVVAAFGGRGDPVALPGGRGTSWRAGDIVLKPADSDEDELSWLAMALPDARVRLARPLPAGTDRYVVDGWTAVRHLPGDQRAGAWLDVIAAGDALHASLAGVPRPGFLDARTHRWSIADRAAWDEVDVGPPHPTPHLDRLRRLSAPLDLPSQLVHGDLTGNVLFAAGLPPAVLDLSLYWRPHDTAAAIVAADALLWDGATLADLAPLLARPAFGQLLIRALRFRLLADLLGHDDHVEDPYVAVVDLAAGLA